MYPSPIFDFWSLLETLRSTTQRYEWSALREEIHSINVHVCTCMFMYVHTYIQYRETVFIQSPQGRGSRGHRVSIAIRHSCASIYLSSYRMQNSTSQWHCMYMILLKPWPYPSQGMSVYRIRTSSSLVFCSENFSADDGLCIGALRYPYGYIEALLSCSTKYNVVYELRTSPTNLLSFAYFGIRTPPQALLTSRPRIPRLTLSLFVSKYIHMITELWRKWRKWRKWWNTGSVPSLLYLSRMTIW